MVRLDRGSNPQSTALEASITPTMPLLMSWNRGEEYCTVTTPTHDVKPLCRILHCPHSHTMQICCAFNYTVTTHAQCGTILYKIVLWRLTHDFKTLWRILYCQNVHTMWIVLENIVLSRQTQNVKPLCRTLYSHDLHTMWNHWAIDWCAVQINTFSENVEYWDAVINRDHQFINFCLRQDNAVINKHDKLTNICLGTLVDA